MSGQEEQDKYAEIGAILKKEREARGISLEIVHDATKIPMDALRAIEEGYTIRTLSSFYLKGFLKIYAKYLDVDISDMLGTKGGLSYIKDKDPVVSADGEDNISLQWLRDIISAIRPIHIGILIAVILFWIVVSGIYGFLARKKKIISKDTEISHVQQIRRAKRSIYKKKENKRIESRIQNRKHNIKKRMSSYGKSDKERHSHYDKKKREIRKAVKKSYNGGHHKVPVKVDSNVVRTVMPKPVYTEPALGHKQVKNIVLTVRAKKKSWLQVKVDGAVVFQSNLRMGAVETWLADDKIEISGRNINQLEFELNGKMIGTLGRKWRRARRVIITKEGLSVTR